MTSTALHLDQPELPLDDEYISRQDTTEDPGRRRVTEDPHGPGRPAPEPGQPGRPAPNDPNAPTRRKGEPGPGGGEEEADDENAVLAGIA